MISPMPFRSPRYGGNHASNARVLWYGRTTDIYGTANTEMRRSNVSPERTKIGSSGEADAKTEREECFKSL